MLNSDVDYNRLSFAAAEPAELAPMGQADWTSGATLPLRRTAAQHLAFVDAGLADVQTLVAGLSPETVVYALNPAGDELGQMSQVLAGYQNVSSIQIFSHGSDGALQLGHSRLNATNLMDYAGLLQSWSSSLAAGADLLLYGCDLAADATGQNFVRQIAALTGADVAASTDLTGNAALGGNWNLEFRTGSIERDAYLTAPGQQVYQGLLALTEDTSIALPGVFNSDVAWGDYTGDGKLDLILSGSNGITKLYKNNGSGGLTEDTSITLPGVIHSAVAWGDYTGDGKLDLILSGSDFTKGITKLYKNNGSGGLTEDTSITLLGVDFGSVAWGDYTGDGKLDLILTGLDGASNPVTKLYKNNGSGGLTEDTSIVLPGVYLGDVAWGDYTGDGKLDLILSGGNSSGNIAKLYKNNGSGGLTEDTSIALPGVVSGSVAWGNYTSDGQLDLILSGYAGSGNSVTKLYKNNGSGGLTEDTSIALPGVAYNALAWGDYTGDGQLDLILTGIDDANNKITKLYKNNGSGGLTEDTSIAPPGLVQGAVAWGDYTGDGQLDLILTGIDDANNKITKLYKNVDVVNQPPVATNDSFTTNQDTPLTVSVGNGVLANDTDADNNPLTANVVTGPTHGTLSLNANGAFTYTPNANFNGTDSFTYYANDGTVNSTNPATVTLNVTAVNQLRALTEDTSIALPGVGLSAVAWGDYTGDGKLDLILSGISNSGLITKLYKNNGSGGLTEDISIALPGVNASAVAWGDYTGDGKLDLILSGYDGAKGITKLYKNNGSGSLTEDTGIALPGVEFSAVAWGDYTGDGNLDLILTGIDNANNPITKLYKNNGSGGLFEDTSIALPGVYGDVAWGDYTGDGNLDLILTGIDNTSARITKLYKNNGSGSLTEDTSIALLAVNASSVAWGDYTGDGKLDLILSGYNGSGNATKLYKNNGSGGLFEDTSIALPGVNSGSVAWGDYTGDGKLDLILTGNNNVNDYNLITKLYKNNGSGGLTEDTSIALLGVAFGAVAWGDYTGDGKLDLILSGQYNGGGNIAQLYRSDDVVNHPPVANPLNNQSSPEDTAVNFTIPATTFTDVDNPTLALSATLADNTALPSWLSFNAATGKFSGTPPQDFNGTLALKVTATDTGNLSASSTFNLVITPVNDAPVVTLASATQAVTNTNSPISGITISDVDAGTNPVVVTLKVNNGKLNVATTPNVTLANNNTGTVTLTGTIANINSALTNLRYSGTNSFSGNDSLNVTVNDRALSDTKAIALNVARNLGTLNKEFELKGSLTNADRTDLYQFTVSGRSRSVQLALEGLKANADLVLLDSNFNVVATSSQLGTKKESIKRLLAAGTYYVQVKLAPGVTARTAYKMELEVNR
jgi:VCBS repeat-containing protein